MKRFRILSFLFALCLAAAVLTLWCVLQQGERFSLAHISDGLMVAAAVDILYSFEFLHTFLGFNASNAGSPFNAYQRVRGDMTYSGRTDRPIIPEYLIIGILAGTVGVLLLLMR